MPFDQENYEAPAITPAHYRVEPQCDDPVLRVLESSRAFFAAGHWSGLPTSEQQHPSLCSTNVIGHFEREFGYTNEVYQAAVIALGSALRTPPQTQRYQPHANAVRFYNDNIGRKLSHVLALFDRAISTRKAEVGG